MWIVYGNTIADKFQLLEPHSLSLFTEKYFPVD